MSRAEIVVDLAAIRHNVTVLKQHVGVPLMAVVKADGYGHGMLPVARAARQAGAEWLGVATADEALALRAAGDDGPILCWLTVPGDDLAPLVDHEIDVTAYTIAELERLPQRARVQLKVDTGLSRGGATMAQWPALVARAREWNITGIWSHFASSEDQGNPSNDEQQKLFDEALEIAADAGIHPATRHLANSGAILLRPQARYDLVRAGLLMYGLSPAPGAGPDLGLVPAMTVRADLALVKEVPAGASVSYGARWTAPAPTTLGLVPVGYGEGVPRAAANRAEVFIAGKRRPIRGSVCMDQVVVDLEGDWPEPGDEVVLFGPGTQGEPTAEDWAVASETISWEIITRMGGRLVRRYEGAHGDNGNLTLAALAAADAVLTVFTSDPGSALGAVRLSSFLNNHRKYENTDARLLGVACSNWDRQGAAAREVSEALAATDLPLFKTRIPFSRRVPSATLAKRPVVLSNPTSAVAEAYRTLAGEVARTYTQRSPR